MCIAVYMSFWERRDVWADLWLINTHNGIRGEVERIHIEDYPAIKQHLDNYWDKIESRADQGETPYNLRNCAYLVFIFAPQAVLSLKLSQLIRILFIFARLVKCTPGYPKADIQIKQGIGFHEQDKIAPCPCHGHSIDDKHSLSGAKTDRLEHYGTRDGCRHR